MDFNDLLANHEIDGGTVLVLRHNPLEQLLSAALPALAADEPDVFNAYQQTQRPQVQHIMEQAQYVASFVRHEGTQGLFVGLYRRHGQQELTAQEIRARPDIQRLEALGYTHEEHARLWFDLTLEPEFFPHYKGKLVINWPAQPPRAQPFTDFYRWTAAGHAFPIAAIYPESKLCEGVPQWDAIDLTSAELRGLPQSWWNRLDAIPGVYAIFDTAIGKFYVGSGSGQQHIGQRWLQYRDTGHCNNQNLVPLHPENFRFTILQAVALGTPRLEIIRLEESWKSRLHTREYGLNGLAPDGGPADGE